MTSVEKADRGFKWKTEIVPTRTPTPSFAKAQAAFDDAWRNARSKNTREAYELQWRRFTAWCGEVEASPMPATPATVCLYLAHRRVDGAGVPTQRMAVAAIGLAHRVADENNPAGAMEVSEALRGFSREAAKAGEATRQAKALTAECIATIRGHLNGLLGTDPLATRDMAMLTVMTDGGLRRSEASALRWCDIAIEDDSSGRVTIRRSKTDQEGEGAVVAITAAAVEDLVRLRELQPGEDEDRPFPIGPPQVSNRVVAVTRAAGLGDGYSGHSPRIGMAQTMTKNGAPAAATMRQGRWARADMVARYTRALAAGEALRYL